MPAAQKLNYTFKRNYRKSQCLIWQASRLFIDTKCLEISYDISKQPLS